MSLFGENLQFYRKRKNMTQEQLADQLEVSRQTVSKWEAGASYPEMEKILQLCDVFSCSMDTLMRENASEQEVEDTQSYDVHMEKRRKHITLGVVIIIFAVASYELLTGIGMAEVIANTIFWVAAIVAILVFVVAGIQHDQYRKNHPQIPEFYSQKEKEHFEEKFPVHVAVGIGVILIGFLIGMNGDSLPTVKGMTEDFYYGIFIGFVDVGVGVLTHAGMGKEKYDIAAYNKENKKEEESDKKVGVWCGCIILVATIIYVITGFCMELWYINWVVYVVAALMCGIVTLILNSKKNKSE